ncbi:MAG: DUF4157 domain-containing protein [Burkholderiales bacterium]
MVTTHEHPTAQRDATQETDRLHTRTKGASAVDTASDIRLATQRRAQLGIQQSPYAAAQRRQIASLTQRKMDGTIQKVDDEQLSSTQTNADPIQRLDEEEPALAQVKADPIQQRDEEEPHSTQAQTADGTASPVQREPDAPAKRNDTGLPDDLKSGIESLSGLSMDSVKVHYNSEKPAQLNALAYAQGTDIHVGPGQEQHLPHEAWHVVQQAEGRVQPTMQMNGGVPVNDDHSLELEADVMGAKALQRIAAHDATSHARRPTGGNIQLKRIGRSTPAAPLQMERAAPLLANERDLLGDTEKLIRGQDRTKDANLIDNAYDKVGENLLLDLNMRYEEELQRTIEHDGYFMNTLKDAVDVIHGTGQIQSVQGTTTAGTSKSSRVDTVMESIKSTPGNAALTHDRLSSGLFNVGLLTANPNPEIQRMNVGYVKLLKMLETQVPYFGGSVEYVRNVKDSFEYWVYHLSTLTKDPDRAYRADEPGAQLPKPMRDYRTHRGLVPLGNQRNLGTGIVEARWAELPTELKQKIHAKLNFVLTQLGIEQFPNDSHARLDFWLKGGKALRLESQSQGHVRTRGPMQPISLGEAETLWNGLSEDQKKEMYGDVTQMPWSDAHLHGGHSWEQHQEHRDLRQDPDLSKLPYRAEPGLENVVGVRGNILETPEVAGEKYRGELSRRFPGELGLVPQDAFEGYKGDIDTRLASGYVMKSYFTIESLVNEFKDKHADWYREARGSFKPIVGGISGHTLGYLNLYSDAQMRYPQFDARWPSMEALRAAMLGALIGDKRHHSYDEVMAASDGMPYRESYGQNQLHYFRRLTYGDVIDSGVPQIKSAASKAREETRNKAVQILTGDRNTVANLIMRVAGFSNEIYDLVKRIIERHCRVFGLPDYGDLRSLDEKIKKKMGR